MDEVIHFACPECGQEIFKTSGKLRSTRDLVNVVCASCGFKFTEDYMLGTARKILQEKVRKMKR
jgi:transcription elongation factor Elf1